MKIGNQKNICYVSKYAFRFRNSLTKSINDDIIESEMIMGWLTRVTGGDIVDQFFFLNSHLVLI